MLSSDPASMSNAESKENREKLSRDMDRDMEMETGVGIDIDIDTTSTSEPQRPNGQNRPILRTIPAPTVKLYLTDNSCTSAVAGIMYQPRPDTLCTYQALVIALGQANASVYNTHRDVLRSLNILGDLDRDLEDWLVYVLAHKVCIYMYMCI